MAGRRLPLLPRLLAGYVRAENGCLVWTKGKTKAGYGTISVDGEKRYTHVVQYERHHGPVPAGKEVCHSCDTPACGEPEHLFAGTHVENLADMVAKGRHRCNPTKGSRSPNAKLTEAQVVEMVAMRAAGSTHKEIADRFGLHRKSIPNILSGRSWAHVHSHISEGAL